MLVDPYLKFRDRPKVSCFRHNLLLTCLVIVDAIYYHRFFCRSRVVEMRCRLKRISLKNKKVYSITENKTFFILIHIIKD